MRRLASLLALVALAGGQASTAQGPRDPNNPTCPPSPNWSTYREMRFTVQQRPGHTPVLLAEGAIDDNMLPRLQEALRTFQGDEIWLRSPGGNARVGNQAGRLIRDNNLTTRIPAGWACFSACNFLFMGGGIRHIDPGGLFIVHMFTFTSDPTVRREISQGQTDRTIGVISDVEQGSALLASEDNDFLIRMGLYRTLLTEIMYRQRAVGDASDHSTMRCLTLEEARHYNVVNDRFDAPAPTPPPAPAQQRRQRNH
jgi:hypothetical protein